MWHKNMHSVCYMSPSPANGHHCHSYLEQKRRTEMAPEGGEWATLGTPLPTLILHLVFQSHQVTGLRTYTQYLVSLQVFNPEGLGPTSTVAVMTDEGGE